MTENTPTPLSLPDAETFLKGKETVRSLQYSAEDLAQFVQGFETVSLSPTAADRLVKLQTIMQQPDWAEKHNAAHQALQKAFQLVTDNPSDELKAQANAMQAIYKSQAPNASSLRMIKNPDLQNILKPLEDYLQQYGGFVSTWPGLQPAQMQKADALITLADKRAALNTEREAAPAAQGLCADPACLIDHSKPPAAAIAENVLAEKPLASKGMASEGLDAFSLSNWEPPVSAATHVHGPDCSHTLSWSTGDSPLFDTSSSPAHSCDAGCDHGTTPVNYSSGYSGSYDNGVHYHGDTPCTHHHAETEAAELSHLSRWTKEGRTPWIAAALGVAGVTAYLMRPVKRQSTETDPAQINNWQERLSDNVKSTADRSV